MIIFIESIILCILFTTVVCIISGLIVEFIL